MDCPRERQNRVEFEADNAFCSGVQMDPSGVDGREVGTATDEETLMAGTRPGPDMITSAPCGDRRKTGD
jgi:hypothetical protein